MKLLLAAGMVLASVGVSTGALASEFCDGFRVGYEKGYCYQEFSCLRPLVPLCPLPGLGESSFEDGYNRGFLDGIADK